MAQVTLREKWKNKMANYFAKVALTVCGLKSAIFAKKVCASAMPSLKILQKILQKLYILTKLVSSMIKMNKKGKDLSCKPSNLRARSIQKPIKKVQQQQ